jgi:hypothetical protein
MTVKSACAASSGAPGGYREPHRGSDHLLIAHRTAPADNHATKTLLFEVPDSVLAPFFIEQDQVERYQRGCGVTAK